MRYVSWSPKAMRICRCRWLIAQLHQDALMQAVDFDDDGHLDWDGYESRLPIMQTIGICTCARRPELMQ
jgi:hypothetical protein